MDMWQPRTRSEKENWGYSQMKVPHHGVGKTWTQGQQDELEIKLLGSTVILGGSYEREKLRKLTFNSYDPQTQMKLLLFEKLSCFNPHFFIKGIYEYSSNPSHINHAPPEPGHCTFKLCDSYEARFTCITTVKGK